MAGKSKGGFGRLSEATHMWRENFTGQIQQTLCSSFREACEEGCTPGENQVLEARTRVSRGRSDPYRVIRFGNSEVFVILR